MSEERWGWQAALGAVFSLLGAPLSLFAGFGSPGAEIQVRSWPCVIIETLMCLVGFGVFLMAVVRLRAMSPLLSRRALIAYIAGMGLEAALGVLLLL